MMTDKNFLFVNNYKEVMKIDSSGNLSIGTKNYTENSTNFVIPTNSTVFNSTDMLRISADGFYVRGVKIPVDENEAHTVYEAFKQWLTWATLTRDY